MSLFLLRGLQHGAYLSGLNSGPVRIERLSLYQFKNYENAELRFQTAFSCLTGPNGAGKTNLLDAVYYCGFCRSSRLATDDLNLMHGREGFRIEAHFVRKERHLNVEIRYRRGGNKEVWCSGDRYTRFSDHIGRLPMVLTGPEDMALIDGYAEERRRFLDGAISTVNKEYLETLIRYNRALAQRNAALKRFREGQPLDQALLDSYAPPMNTAAQVIQLGRKNFLDDLGPLFMQYYQQLSGAAEIPNLEWTTNFPSGEDLALHFQKTQSRDLFLGRTGSGPHKDDLQLLLDGHPARQLGSQGQKKTLLYALRLAQWKWLGDQIGSPPLLLLDDVFDKLDRTRVTARFSLLADSNQAQVLITDTNLNRVEDIFQQIGVPCQSIVIEPGRIARI